jgi:quercetin 2,3-dioxygenase
LGAAARFGRGDVQWMTAGRGIVHSEMFPLLRPSEPNPLELFQIWINLPKDEKMVEPHFSMFWESDIPRLEFGGAGQPQTEVTVIAGELEGRRPPPPPPHSWASRADSGAAIWTIRMQPGARWELPPASHAAAVRSLYFFAGQGLRIDGQDVKAPVAVELKSDVAVQLEAGATAVDCLLLQARPIAEPVSHYGPFVMNTQAEIRQAISDYQRTQFGGWPWPSDAPVHPREEGRFARHADGRIERPAADAALSTSAEATSAVPAVPVAAVVV